MQNFRGTMKMLNKLAYIYVILAHQYFKINMLEAFVNKCRENLVLKLNLFRPPFQSAKLLEVNN